MHARFKIIWCKASIIAGYAYGECLHYLNRKAIPATLFLNYSCFSSAPMLKKCFQYMQIAQMKTTVHTLIRLLFSRLKRLIEYFICRSFCHLSHLTVRNYLLNLFRCSWLTPFKYALDTHHGKKLNIYKEIRHGRCK